MPGPEATTPKPETPPAAPADQPAAAPKSTAADTIKTVKYEGYEFQVDSALLDDVELLEMIDGIENGEKPALIIALLKKLVGDTGYEAMKAYFKQKDGVFKMTTLAEIYKNIFENFDPKG